MNPTPATPPELPPDELTALIGEVLNGTAAPEQRERLDALLLHSAAARQLYRRHVNLHAALRTRFALSGDVRSQIAPAGLRVFAPPAKSLFAAWRWRAVVLGTLAAAIALIVTLALRAPGTSQGTSDAIAHVSRLAGARWAAGNAPLALDAALRPGMLDLVDGLAEITLVNGTRVVLESPARLNLRSPTLAHLEYGRLVAHVTPEGRGFSIETPQARVVDLGTEFGVSVAQDGGTEVQVFRGEVTTAPRNRGKDSDQRLTAGNAVSIAAGTSRGIPFQPQSYIRMFPTDQDGGQPGGPCYNHSRFDALHVVPAARTVTVDGDLSDWDRSGAFYSACMPPYHESHHVEGVVMYDAKYLYIGAHVGDPAPMQSLMDPAADPAQYAWRGGSVIVRLSTDPKLGYPLQGMGRAEHNTQHPDYGKRAEDLSEGIVHITLWYYRPAHKARLQLSYGMDFHGDRIDPQGAWTGAFKMDPNGLGYTLEYAIPWELVKAQRAPQAGDEMAANWTVHWSDQHGQLSRGHLVEITNFQQQPYRFLRAGTWGKAIYHARGQLPPATVVPRKSGGTNER